MKHRQLVLTCMCTVGLMLWLVNWSPMYTSSSTNLTPQHNRRDRSEHQQDNTLTQSARILEEPLITGQNHIFFVESSCGVGGTRRHSVSMKTRQACAVESAALTNPNTTVYYVDTCVNAGELVIPADNVVSQVLSYNNVKVLGVKLDHLVRHTPLEIWYDRGGLLTSSFPIEHASDVLRLLVLWKYGGIYVDLDFVFIRSLEDLGLDFAVAERDDWIANGVLSFSTTGLGHAVVDRCLRHLAQHFDGSNWSHNGPALITSILFSLCNSSSVKEMTQERCWGFKVHPPVLFYPFRYMSWWLIFAESSSDAFMAYALKNSTYAVHAWNKMSHDTPVNITSKQPYALLAKRFCPRVFSAVDRIF